MLNVDSKSDNKEAIKDDDTIILQLLYDYPSGPADFIKKYQGQLYAILRNKFSTILSVTDCKEITIEAFTKAIKKFDTYDPKKGKLRPWLFQIGKNTARDRIRKTINTSKKTIENIIEKDSIHSDLTQLRKDGYCITIEKIKDGLKQLTNDEQNILNAFLFESDNHEGLTTFLAEKYITTIGNIRVIKLRGKRKLLNFLKGGKNASD